MNGQINQYTPEFDSFKGILLKIARENTVSGVLNTFVHTIAARPHVARVCVWLVEDIDERTGIAPDDHSDEPHLHLVATAGTTETEPHQWQHEEGTYALVPFHEPYVGSAAAEVTSKDAPDDSQWRVPEWARKEGIPAYGVTPMIHKDNLLGLVGIFLNRPVSAEAHREGMTWQRIFSDHLAAAVVNARAFEEILRLRMQLELENRYLREEVNKAYQFGEILGKSEALRRVLKQVELVAPTEANVLILGESGTGKELIARAIHQHSSRSDGPIITVNCAAIPGELFESEFFGHVKGSFTGAIRDRTGRFALADGGTLFLDEIGEIPLELQGKLLRVLQSGTFERIGEEKTRRADVRVIAASNRDLRKDVEAGKFRQDLYFRLSVFPIEVPPLRQRPEDIAVLATHYIEQKCTNEGIRGTALKQRHLQQLQNYNWPGNVRELQNVIERALIVGGCGELDFGFLSKMEKMRPLNNGHLSAVGNDGPIIAESQWKQMEKENLLLALGKSGWKVQGEGGAADLLGVKPTTLRSRMKSLGIEKSQV